MSDSVTDRPAAAGQPSEQQSRDVAEAARQTEWTQPSFLRELFLGNFRPDLIAPFPDIQLDRPEFVDFYARFERFMQEEVDSGEIDRSGEYPDHVIDGLRKLGAFGMKIPTEYGGLGFSQVEYDRVMGMLASRDGNIAVLLSAHQSIGAPQPIKLFGSDKLKKEYLPRMARGAISAFALTEPAVGSDPASLACTAEQQENGDWVLNGRKLWCTNGTFAEIIVVMARNPETDRISAFIVDASWEGVEVEHRCRFMGLKALQNGVIGFNNVRVPADHLVGEEGKGLKYALITLNAGRLALPSSSAGVGRQCLQIVREWANERVQWGRPIGKHEAVAHMISDIAATTFAMESVSQIASWMNDSGKYDVRLEAAAAKEWNTSRGWELVDTTMQVRGGRGYETEHSLRGRGEQGVAVERMMRDFRINTIIEGSSEIMHLFIAREAVDKHLQVSGMLIDRKVSLGRKIAALPRIGLWYAGWYATRWLGWGWWPRYSGWGKLATHMRFADRMARRMARQVFHGMIWHGPKLEHKQAFLFHIVDVGLELFAITAACSRARTMMDKGEANAAGAVQLADVFSRTARRRVRQSLRDLWRNADTARYRLARRVLDGEFKWMEHGILGLPPGEADKPARAANTGEPEPAKAG